MSEKKPKSATEANEAAPKKAKRQRAKRKPKEANPAEVRKKVSKIVQAKALKMAKAVMGDSKKTETTPKVDLATVKYLFEVAAIYPPETDQDKATDEEDSLAKTLLNRLNIPDKPIRREEDEDEEGASAEEAVGDAEAKDLVVNENEENNKPERG